MKGQKGFTLIELMIVVAVIGLLSAIAIPKYQEFAKKGAVASGIATLSALKTNIEDHMAQNGSFPTNLADVGGIADNALGTVSIEGSTAKIVFDSGAANGATVTLTRATTGAWDCSYIGEVITADLNITGCEYTKESKPEPEA
ncbi:pilin [Photobacterium damselae]|uniref:pilin n=2 Tax=Vibrionaceae TaxID=641 RepID=UPI0035A915C1